MDLKEFTPEELDEVKAFSREIVELGDSKKLNALKMMAASEAVFVCFGTLLKLSVGEMKDWLQVTLEMYAEHLSVITSREKKE